MSNSYFSTQVSSSQVEHYMPQFGTTSTTTGMPAPTASDGGAAVGGLIDFGPDTATIQSLTPDALMAYCESRLTSINQQVSASFTDQQRNAAEVQAIGSVASALNSDKANDVTDPAKCTALEKQLGAVIQSLKASDPNSSAIGPLTDTYNNLVWSGDGGKAFNQSTDPDAPDFIDLDQHEPDKSTKQGDNRLGTTELQGYAQALSDVTDKLNSASELGMINLQQLMSERQTAISLTTNLIQSLGEQSSKIADNIGH